MCVYIYIYMCVCVYHLLVLVCNQCKQPFAGALAGCPYAFICVFLSV